MMTTTRLLLAIVSAAMLGTVFGSLVSSKLRSEQVAPLATVKTHQLILFDERNKQTARLESFHGRSSLRFLTGDSSTALEVGMEDAPTNPRFIRFYGVRGNILMALNSFGTRGDVTLYLGDANARMRIVMGAIPTDVENEPKDWGLQFNRPGSSESVFSILTKTSDDHTRPAGASISLIKASGDVWSVH